MQQPDVDVRILEGNVLAEIEQHAKEYDPPKAGETLGSPWSKQRVELEVQKMRALLVAPVLTEYLCDDMAIPEAERLPKGIRQAYVVAKDQDYWLLFDYEAEDFVLVYAGDSSGLFSIGIRGDATSTFLAR